MTEQTELERLREETIQLRREVERLSILAEGALAQESASTQGCVTYMKENARLREFLKTFRPQLEEDVRHCQSTEFAANARHRLWLLDELLGNHPT